MFKEGKKAGEKDIVKRFYEHNKRCLEDSQIKIPPENDPVDITVKEGDQKVNYQVTLFRNVERVALAFKKVNYWVNKEDIKEDIIKAIKDKELKTGGRTDLILLLFTLFPVEDIKDYESAVAGLSINSSFKEIYIVTPRCNISVKTSL